MNEKHKGSIFGIGQHILTAALTFVSIPIFITNLGSEQYGIYSLMTILGNLNVIANVGLNTTLIKTIAQQGKNKQSEYDIIITILLVLIIIIPLTIISYIYKEYLIIKVMNINIHNYERTEELFVYMLLANIILIIGSIYVAVLEGIGKFHITNSLQLTYNCIFWVGSIILVSKGFGLGGVGQVMLFSAIIWFILVLINFRKNWGDIVFSGIKNNIKFTIKKILSHSLKVFGGGIINILIEPISKIVTSNLIGISEVGYIEIANKIKTQFWNIFLKALAPYYPLISSNLYAINSKLNVQNLQKKIILIIIPLVYIIIYTMPYMIYLWLNTTDPKLINTIQIYVIAYILSTVAIPAYYVQLSFKPEKIIFAHIINLSVNILVIVTVYDVLGYSAIVLGASLGFFIHNILYIYSINVKIFKLNLKSLKIKNSIVTIIILQFVTILFIKYLPINSILYISLYILTILIVSICNYIYSGVWKNEIVNIRKIK